MRFLEEISLTFEEIEAIRLKDMEGLEQKEAADQMKVSRPTFSEYSLRPQQDCHSLLSARLSDRGRQL
jgi:predicted DNA-binding protein (UPF0251 family)